MRWSSDLARELAPTRRLRAALNMDNPLLAQSRTEARRPAGVTIDLSHELGKALALEVVLCEMRTAADSLAAIVRGECDVGFMAVDPARALALHFSPAYVSIEGAFVVPEASSIVRNAHVDRKGVKVVAGAGSAYELYLSRTLRDCEIVKVPTSEEVVAVMMDRQHQAGAGIRQTLEAEAAQTRGLRVLQENFMAIEQAMAVSLAKDASVHAALDDFMYAKLRDGYVADAFVRHGIVGARIPFSDGANGVGVGVVPRGRTRSHS